MIFVSKRKNIHEQYKETISERGHKRFLTEHCWHVPRCIDQFQLLSSLIYPVTFFYSVNSMETRCHGTDKMGLIHRGSLYRRGFFNTGGDSLYQGSTYRGFVIQSGIFFIPAGIRHARVRYVGVLFHTFSYYWAVECRSLDRALPDIKC